MRQKQFPFAVIGLDHGHIFGMCNGLLEAGGTLTQVYDRDREKVNDFIKKYPQAVPVETEEEIIDNPP